MRKGISGLVNVCFVGAVLTYGASAEAAKSCNGCTAAQVEAFAAELGRGDHYVYDLPGNHLYLFTTECEPIVGGITCYAYEDTPTADMLSNFNTYHQAWTQNHLSEEFEVNIEYSELSANPGGGRESDDGYVNAYDTVYISSYQNTLAAYLKDPHHYTGTLALVMAVMNNTTSQFDGVDIIVTVTFHDRSKRVLKWSKANHRFEPVPNSAVDSDNNTLAENGGSGGPHGYFFNDGPNGHHYNPGNVAVLLGVAPPDIHEIYYQCSWVPHGTGGSLTCTAH